MTTTFNDRHILFSIATTIALCAPTFVQGRQSIPDNFVEEWGRVQSEFTRLLGDEGIVGGSLWFIQGNDALAREHFGLADRNSNRPVDEHTIYHWASITKTFTGIAIMQLRDRDLLSLDDPAVDYIPELRQIHNPFGDIEAVTIRRLMEHSSGLRASTWPWGGSEPWHPHEPTEWGQLVAMFPYTQIEFEPGERFSYSNPGIILLGRIIELLSGDPFEAYIDKNIFSPLGMTRSYFDNTPYYLMEHRSNNYFVTDGHVQENGLDFNTGITVSNGGLNAPVGDMIKYMAFLSGAADNDFVLSRTSLQEMWEESNFIEEDNDTRHYMGLNFFLLDHLGQRYVGHTGGQQGFVSFFYIDPATHTGAIAAFNTLGLRGNSDGPPRPNTRRVLSELRELVFHYIIPLFR